MWQVSNLWDDKASMTGVICRITLNHIFTCLRKIAKTRHGSYLRERRVANHRDGNMKIFFPRFGSLFKVSHKQPKLLYVYCYSWSSFEWRRVFLWQHTYIFTVRLSIPCMKYMCSLLLMYKMGDIYVWIKLGLYSGLRPVRRFSNISKSQTTVIFR